MGNEYKQSGRLLYETPENANHFFGFHDLCPWNTRGDALVLLRTGDDVAQRVPTSSDVAEVCLWFPESNEVRPIGETTTWNWQQGARQQWLIGAEDKVIYNTSREGSMVSVIYDVATEEERVLERPVYALSPDGMYALAPNFARLHKAWPAYGYDGPVYDNMDEVVPVDDGIFVTNLASGERSLLISLKELSDFGGGISNTNQHFVSHLSYSPTGEKICFFHRFFTSDGHLFSRFVVADVDGGSLKLLSQEKATHFDWRDDEGIFLWTRFLPQKVAAARGRGLLSSPLLRPLLNLVRKMRPGLKQRLWKEGYYMLKTDGSGGRELIGYGVLNADGHPMFSNDRKVVLTDTYPDSNGIMSLMLYDLDGQRRVDVAQIHSPEQFKGDLKCDLHPRWNRDCTQICVDCPESGRRQVRIYAAPPLG